MILPRAKIVRYAVALREGGSVPAVVEADTGETLIAKWRGAGQGAAVLVAEVIVGELARAVGLAMPELSVLELDAAIAKTERDEEIRDILLASVGDNLGMTYLDGALAYDPAVAMPLPRGLVETIVLFDAYVMNVDRTARNTNLLWWREGLWLIDHGAAMYWHHGWDGTSLPSNRPFPLVAEHVLLPRAEDFAAAEATLRERLTPEAIEAAVASVPDAWLPDDAERRRAAYVDFMVRRTAAIGPLREEAERARGGV
jgi:hypothetical protein